MKRQILKRLLGAAMACIIAGTAVPCGIFTPAREVCAAEPTSDADLTAVFN